MDAVNAAHTAALAALQGAIDRDVYNAVSLGEHGGYLDISLTADEVAVLLAAGIHEKPRD